MGNEATRWSKDRQPAKLRGKNKRTLLIEQIKVGVGLELSNAQCLMLFRQIYCATMDELRVVATDKSMPAFVHMTVKTLLDKKYGLQRLREIERILQIDKTPIIQDSEINILFNGSTAPPELSLFAGVEEENLEL